jgi:hypothetical protein
MADLNAVLFDHSAKAYGCVINKTVFFTKGATIGATHP